MAEENRKGRWVPLVYYYLATVIGLSVLLVGLIGGLQGLVKAAFPAISDEVRYQAPVERPEGPDGRRDKVSVSEQARLKEEAIESARIGGFAAALRGLVAAVVGAPVFLWHLRQARRQEPLWLGTSPLKRDKELE